MGLFWNYHTQRQGRKEYLVVYPGFEGFILWFIIGIIAGILSFSLNYFPSQKSIFYGLILAIILVSFLLFLFLLFFLESLRIVVAEIKAKRLKNKIIYSGKLFSLTNPRKISIPK